MYKKNKHIYFFDYYMYNAIKQVYSYIDFIYRNNQRYFNALDKKKVLLLSNYGSSSFDLEMNYAPWYFVNVNISMVGSFYHRYKLLQKIRTQYVEGPIKPLIRLINSSMPVIKNFYGFVNYFVKWYMSTNRQEKTTFNFNNIGLLSDQLSIMFQGWAKNYNIFKKIGNEIFNYLKNQIKKVNKLINLYSKVKMVILFGYKKWLTIASKKKILKRIFLKKKKKIFKKLCKFVMKVIQKKTQVNNYYLQFFKKFDVIYKRYIEIHNIEAINYNNFSFLYILKRKSKRQKAFIRNLNLVSFINNIILQFFIFIFLHWLNLFVFNTKNQINYIFNTNKQKIIMVNMSRIYIDIKGKYRKRKYKKINFLTYFLNTSFMLYFRNIGMHNKTNMYINGWQIQIQ